MSAEWRHTWRLLGTSSLKEGAMLHVWGFLGNVTWALSRNNAVAHCYISLATQQFKRKAYQQNCCARDNSHEDVSMVTGWLFMDFYWYRQSGFEIVLVYLATDSCWFEEWFSVPRPSRLDVYVCSKSCWLCLRVCCVRGPEEIGRTRLVRALLLVIISCVLNFWVQ
jgi:hypothetical protein